MNDLIEETTNYIFQNNTGVNPCVVKTALIKFQDECKKQQYATIVELIGEMSWGIDLPQVFNIRFMPPEDLAAMEGANKPTLQPITRAINPVDMEPIFDAIYCKLKNNPNYNAWEHRNDEYKRLNADYHVLNAEYANLIATSNAKRIKLIDIIKRYVAAEIIHHMGTAQAVRLSKHILDAIDKAIIDGGE